MATAFVGRHGVLSHFPVVLLGILGIPFPDGFGLVPLGGNDIWLHLASGAILLVAGFLGTSTEPATA